MKPGSECIKRLATRCDINDSWSEYGQALAYWINDTGHIIDSYCFLRLIELVCFQP